MSPKRFIAVAALALMAAPIVANAQSQSPTDARLYQRNAAEIARKQREYKRCGSFAIRVYNACLQQAGTNSNAIRSCRANYQRAVQGCQSILQ